ncbi:hypothetical protein FA95DRAFT_1601694 [Auriscalpium vulgare]|uniref:Uncharacterized protein n=1 Tax=Auriscalpium vulgare TaxID=40419 RepID=A0ACB8S9M8_9AGAM|nr:hypothetical protein FA95DRAFT_1601694 [Auriscalpium vulgare]
MSGIYDSYASLNSKSSRTDVSDALQSIVNGGVQRVSINSVMHMPICLTAPLSSVDESTRRKLVDLLLHDLNACKADDAQARLTTYDLAQGLLALKSLAKHPSGARILASAQNLSDLLALFKTYKDNHEAGCEALRCVANTLLLVETSRQTLLEKDVNGGEVAMQLLEKSTLPDHVFLASRILFLCTASSFSASAFIISLVENKPPGRHLNAIEIIGSRLDSLTGSILGGMKMAREAMTDLLKFTFNILAHYPKLIDCERVTDLGAGDGKVMGEYWSERLDGILPPLLRAFNTLPPSFPSPLAPPLSHIIHALIATPITTALQPQWFTSHSPANSGRLSSSTSSPASPVLSPSSGDSKDAKHGAFDRAFSRLTVGRRSQSRASSPSPPARSDNVQRAFDLLEVSLSHYLPGASEPDDPSVRKLAKDEADSTLDELLCPLVMLVTKLVTADTATRDRVREWILPTNLDRTSPLEGRPDLLGRMLRLLTSVYHPRLKDVSGEMLFVLCNSDATTLMAQVGYGNVAGYLFNKGIVTAPPGDAGGAPISADGAQINPITGAVQEPREEVEMTEEEREAEAERLFVLFDRLERSGAIPPSSNPIRRAVEEGRFG